MSTLQNKRYIVTGASTGIGYAIARDLIAEGAKVAITARNEERLRVAAEELGAFAVAADVGQEDQAIERVAYHDAL